MEPWRRCQFLRKDRTLRASRLNSNHHERVTHHRDGTVKTPSMRRPQHPAPRRADSQSLRLPVPHPSYPSLSGTLRVNLSLSSRSLCSDDRPRPSWDIALEPTVSKCGRPTRTRAEHSANTQKNTSSQNVRNSQLTRGQRLPAIYVALTRLRRVQVFSLCPWRVGK